MVEGHDNASVPRFGTRRHTTHWCQGDRHIVNRGQLPQFSTNKLGTVGRINVHVIVDIAAKRNAKGIRLSAVFVVFGLTNDALLVVDFVGVHRTTPTVFNQDCPRI